MEWDRIARIRRRASKLAASGNSKIEEQNARLHFPSSLQPSNTAVVGSQQANVRLCVFAVVVVAVCLCVCVCSSLVRSLTRIASLLRQHHQLPPPLNAPIDTHTHNKTQLNTLLRSILIIIIIIQHEQQQQQNNNNTNNNNLSQKLLQTISFKFYTNININITSYCDLF